MIGSEAVGISKNILKFGKQITLAQKTSDVSYNASVGTAIFGGILIFFISIQMGTFTIVTGYVRGLSTMVAALFKWISPFHYWSQGLSVIEYNNFGGYFLNILFLTLLTVILLVVSHLILRSKGVRE